MGVFLSITIINENENSLPHVRGGVSSQGCQGLRHPQSSPRAWGCFPVEMPPTRKDYVFPTCVGVFPGRLRQQTRRSRLPHVRGGVSPPRRSFTALAMSSPRAWGCFPGASAGGSRDMVFPTCVGVFLELRKKLIFILCLPHVRGGVSNIVVFYAGDKVSSPRAWGCFQTKQNINIQYVSLPHVRGGVSFYSETIAEMAWSSPRAWGCFSPLRYPCQRPLVFPTCVGVFLSANQKSSRTLCLPHVRGGVSFNKSKRKKNMMSSPRAWGCFSFPSTPIKEVSVFPTCVGVFLKE